MDLGHATYEEAMEFLSTNFTKKKDYMTAYNEFKLSKAFEEGFDPEDFESESESFDDEEKALSSNDSTDMLYELVVVSNNFLFEFETPKNDVYYGSCYYYIEEHTEESLMNKLGVLACGGYYVAVCMFENKRNITMDIMGNMRMRTRVGNGEDILFVSEERKRQLRLMKYYIK